MTTSSPVRARLESALGPTIVVGRELGDGGMAHVFLARDDRLGRDLVIKVIDPDVGGVLSAERFAREIRIAADLVSPYIVPLIDAGVTTDGLAYYTMPFIRGESLRAHLRRGETLPPREAVSLMRDVMRALVYAHERGIIHRDIKPENILLSTGSAVVADFGIAKALAESTGRKSETSKETALTAVGISLGTPAYMSPEQIVGDAAIDARADLYAWGLVAYELLAGRHPFADRITPQALFRAQLIDDPQPLGELRPELPEIIVDIVMACLEKDPVRRPADASVVLRTLEWRGEGAAVRRGWRVVDNRFRLSDTVCRRIDRALLEPKIIGGEMRYLENSGDPSVLIFAVHGMGHEGAEFSEFLRSTPHRAVAPTLYGFAPDDDDRTPLDIGAQLTLLRELLREVVDRVKPSRVVLLGYSSGADAVMRMIADAPDDAPKVDACVALGPNLSLATCFASRIFVKLEAGRALRIEELRQFGADAADFDEWLDIMTYLLHTLRKFRGNLGPVSRFAEGIMRPFEEQMDTFARWFRAVKARTSVMRCVFENSATCVSEVQSLKLRHFDDAILGSGNVNEALLLERSASHHALATLECIERHVNQVVKLLA